MSIRHPAAVFLCMAMAMSLVWSRALLSIIPVIFIFLVAVDIEINPFRVKWVLTPKNVFGMIKYKPFIIVFALYFLLFVVSIVYAGNLSEWWQLTHPKFPFIILPLGFLVLKPFSRKEYMLITLSMIVLAVWSTIWVQVAFYSEHYLFSQSLGFGGSLPTPINHIRYSVVISLSMIICLAFAIEGWKLRYSWERWAYGLTSVYLFYFLHVLSVRSGLAIAYAGIFLMVLFYLRKFNPVSRLAIIACIVIAPFLAYKVLPGFEQKINYTIYDLGMFKQDQGNAYSDSERWQSWRAGIVIGNQHPFFGTGPGKFRTSLKTYYKDELKKDDFTRPHNQFINVFAEFGLFGLAVFLFFLLYPMTFRFFWKPPLIPVLYIMQILTMLVEHPLDTEFGSMLFVLLTVLGLSYQDGLPGSTTGYKPV
ncbi:MAG TPA: O-antigen ligase family protein [Saprospiraceae bacterium]|nr:O-antigen ligase family protein [Saprospiraceae bacterium]